jgi:putative DNA primase/helicase
MSNTKPTPKFYAEIYTERFGFEIVPLPPKTKYPTEKDWGNNTLKTKDEAGAFFDKNPDWNMGVALAGSCVCSLDIDDAEGFQIILDAFGIDKTVLEAYPTIKGKGHRVMFRVPDGESLPYCKINWPTKGEQKKHFTVFELRSACDGVQRQDVLPPSIHPDTLKPYEWIIKPDQKTGFLPSPPDWLLAIWKSFDTFKPQLVDCCPWLEKKQISKPKAKARVHENSTLPPVQEEFNKAHDIGVMLNKYGYKQIGGRFLSPHSSTGLPGVNVFDDESCWIHHASDPLCSDDSGQPVSCYDLFCYYDCDGDKSKAFKEAAKLLDIPLTKPTRAEREKRTLDKPKPQPVPKEISKGKVKTQAEKHIESKIIHWDQFKCLGHDNGSIFILPARTKQVISTKADAVSRGFLLSIATIDFWEILYPMESKTGGSVNWITAQADLVDACTRMKPYDPSKQRGRGAWYDNGLPVLHLGTSLLVDGHKKEITDHDSEFIYTQQAPIEKEWKVEPASLEDAKKLYGIFQGISWQKPEHAYLALGWVMLAPICGSLSWRPHLWLTAKRGAGKTWLQENIIDKLVGGIMIYCQGGTTEAGIRQRLQQDARPIMFDEAESENKQAQQRMQSVIELARQSSSDSGAEIMKGTVSGHGMSFKMRSMFLLGSINVGLKQAADESRFSIVRLVRRENEKKGQFRAFENEVLTLLTDEYCASIRARIYRMIPTIRENAKNFATIAAAKLGSQRIGDQIGTLLAGALAIESDDILEPEEITDILELFTFDDAMEAESISDEQNCLNTLLQYQIKVEGGHSISTRTVGELIQIAAGLEITDNIPPKDAKSALARAGINQVKNSIQVANSHKEIKKALDNTAWEGGWKEILERVDGAIKGKNPARFASSPSRYVEIPLTSL